MPIRGPYIIPRRSWFHWHSTGARYFRDMRFKGLRSGFRRVKSEVHFLSMLRVKDRRARLRHRVKQAYDFRKRGQYVGPLLFEVWR